MSHFGWTLHRRLDGYTASQQWVGTQIICHLADPVESSKELRGWFEMWVSTSVTDPTLVYSGHVNLYASTFPRQAASAFAESDAWPDDSIARSAYEEPLRLLVKAMRDSMHTAEVFTADQLGEVEDTFVIDRLLDGSGITRLVAPGGTGKSYMAAWLGLAIAGVGGDDDTWLNMRTVREHRPVLYLDWESNPQVWSNRLHQLRRGHQIPMQHIERFQYMQMRGPLYRSVRAVRERIINEGIGFIILDSSTHARGASGEGPAEESAIRMFDAIDSLKVPGILIDHKSKEAMARGRTGGYGSVMIENRARMEWEVVVATASSEPRSATVLMRVENTKVNNIARQPDIGLRVKFTSNERGHTSSVVIHEINSSEVPTKKQARKSAANPESSPQSMTIREALEMVMESVEGSVTTAELADRMKVLGVEAADDSVARKMRDAIGDGLPFRNVAPEGKPARWARHDDP